MSRARQFFVWVVLIAAIAVTVFFVRRIVYEQEILKSVIVRLQADSRIAEVLVTGVNFDEKTQQTFTTIKFLEYDAEGQPLEPKYFTFSGNIIQFQSFVIRFADNFIRNGDRLRGKSVYLFLKAFMLDGKNTQEFDITPVNAIPPGYKLKGKTDPFEEKLWKSFWAYALDAKTAQQAGVKNAQIEAPGTMFVPGNLYTIKIEHDGGMRIDVTKLPPILKGEKIPSQ
jgi:hypothetical protein